jgi:hypothetical protein
MSLPVPEFIRFGREICGDPRQAEHREWWLANGLGAYAAGANCRAQGPTAVSLSALRQRGDHRTQGRGRGLRSVARRRRASLVGMCTF